MEKYPKFKQNKECAFPERDNCNYDDENPESRRCPYMKYDNSKSIFDVTRWGCTYKKEEKQSNCDNKKKELKGGKK